ncbi:pyruvate kinase [Vibrio cholerae]
MFGVTVGDGCQSTLDFENCLKHGVSHVRFNLANVDIQRNLLKYMDNLNRAEINTGEFSEKIIDIPYPKKKIRYSTYKENRYDVSVGDRFMIVDSEENLDCLNKLYVRQLNLESLNDDDEIFIGDGELVFKVVQSGKNPLIEAQNNWFVSNSKSISIAGMKNSTNSKLSPEILNVLKSIQYEFKVALSFVESVEDVLSAINLFEVEGINCNGIVSKIESKEGVDNISEVLSVSPDIMIARGDLLLNTGVREFASSQEKLILAANRVKGKTYVATELFSSLTTRDIPSRSELSDFYNLKTKISNPIFVLTKESSMIGALNRSLQIINQLG